MITYLVLVSLSLWYSGQETIIHESNFKASKVPGIQSHIDGLLIELVSNSHFHQPKE